MTKPDMQLANKQVATLLAQAAEQIGAALGLNRGEARREARLLAAHGLDVAPAWLVAHDRDPLNDDQASRFRQLCARRIQGEPIAYLLGKREFYGRDFGVTPAVLIPRPETEHLVEAALDRFTNEAPRRVLDIGTGSGCVAISLALERPAWAVIAVDISPAALAVARDNGERLAAKVDWLESDLFAALPGQCFDLIVSNPPYIAADDCHLRQGDLRFEPATALASGADGLEALRAIVEQAPAHLRNGGWLLLEHGFEQGEAVRQRLVAAGFAAVFTLADLAGHARISGGQWQPDRSA